MIKYETKEELKENFNNYLNTISVKAKSSAGASGGGEDKKLKKNIEYILDLNIGV